MDPALETILSWLAKIGMVGGVVLMFLRLRSSVQAVADKKETEIREDESWRTHTTRDIKELRDGYNRVLERSDRIFDKLEIIEACQNEMKADIAVIKSKVEK